jgi:hypothetical protein
MKEIFTKSLHYYWSIQLHYTCNKVVTGVIKYRQEPEREVRPPTPRREMH